MRLALQLARRARRGTWPNPMVGAVVARGDRVVGAGYHHRAGQPHAEVLALDAAGDLARGADLYVTLEPCHCFGRTPPCTDRILAAGVRRVFVGTRDPNPRECGGGLRALRRAGVRIVEGVLARECRQLNEVYNLFIRQRRPFVLWKVAASLDGRIAAEGGDSRWITGPQSRAYAHWLRTQSDAVLVGVGTVLKDDPALNVRHVRGKNPAVGVLDSRLRTPPDARLLRLRRGAPVRIFCAPGARAARARALRAAGAELVPVPVRAGRTDVRAMLRWLWKRGVHQVLVEGGAEVAGAFLESRLVDRIAVVVAPCLLGSSGVPLARWRGPSRVSRAPRLSEPEWRRIGEDVSVTGRLGWPGWSG